MPASAPQTHRRKRARRPARSWCWCSRGKNVLSRHCHKPPLDPEMRRLLGITLGTLAACCAAIVRQFGGRRVVHDRPLAIRAASTPMLRPWCGTHHLCDPLCDADLIARGTLGESRPPTWRVASIRRRGDADAQWRPGRRIVSTAISHPRRTLTNQTPGRVGNVTIACAVSRVTYAVPLRPVYWRRRN